METFKRHLSLLNLKLFDGVQSDEKIDSLFLSCTILCVSLTGLGAYPPANGIPPAQLSSFMVQRFDTTGDQALNLDEQTAAMTAFREHQRGGRRGGGGNQ